MIFMRRTVLLTISYLSLWLNEGFASYVETIGVDFVEPDLKMSDRFTVTTMHAALSRDAFDTSHPISVEVGHPDEIGEIFDDVSYEKGASVIRMMAAFLGEEVFAKGINAYIEVLQFIRKCCLHLTLHTLCTGAQVRQRQPRQPVVLSD